MQPLLDIPMYSQSWQDNGVELVVDGSMEAAGTGAYGSGGGSVLSKDNVIYYAGTQSLKINAPQWGYASQNILNVGRRYHMAACGRGNGGAGYLVLKDNGAGPVWEQTTTAASWQVKENTAVATGNLFVMYQYGAGVNDVWVDNLSVQEQFLYTRNRGLLAQTPQTSRVQLGDGRTAASFPAMLPLTKACRKGMAFNGSQYAEIPTPIPNGTYTLCFLITRESTAGQVLLDCRQSAGTGFFYFDLGTGNLSGSSGTTYVDDVATRVNPCGPLIFAACAGITLRAPGATTLFTRHTYASNWVGKAFGFQMFPGTLTPRQLSDIRQRMLAEVF